MFEIQLMPKFLYTTIYLCGCAFAEFCCYGPYNLRWGYFLIRFIMSRACALYWSDFWSAYQNTLVLLLWNLSISLIRWGKTNLNIDIKGAMFNFWINYWSLSTIYSTYLVICQASVDFFHWKDMLWTILKWKMFLCILPHKN